MKKLLSGFTLIELLVVMSIIGILATLLITNFTSSQKRARDTIRKSDLRNIKTALAVYNNDKVGYPGNVVAGDLKIGGCGTDAAPAACTWGSVWTRGTETYMDKLPSDPNRTGTVNYRYVGSSTTYTLSACLENTGDSACNGTGTWCTGASPAGCVYEVTP